MFSPDKVIIVSEGLRYSSLTLNCVMSVLRHFPEKTRVSLIHGECEPYLLPLLSSTGRVDLHPISEFSRRDYASDIGLSTILKIDHFLDTVKQDEKCILLDADTMLLSDPSNELPSELEIGLTMRASGPPFNAGVLFAKKNEKTVAFFKKFRNDLNDLLGQKKNQRKLASGAYGGLSQSALAKSLHEIFKDYRDDIEKMLLKSPISANRLEFPSLTILDCSRFNQVESLDPKEVELPHILHLKAKIRLYIETRGMKNDARGGESARLTRELFEGSLQQGLEELMTHVQDSELPSEPKIMPATGDLGNGIAERKGVWPSEAVQMAKVFSALNTKTLIESGRARAESTYRLARMCDSMKIISIDSDTESSDAIFGKTRVANLTNVEVLDGDSEKLLSDLVKRSNDDVALFIDGPKGKNAIRLSKRLVSRYKNISVIVFHDMHHDFMGKSNDSRHELDTTFDLVWFGDALTNNSYSRMDERTSEKNNWTQRGKGSRSPTVAFVFPTWRDRLHRRRTFAARRFILNLFDAIDINPVGPKFLLGLYAKLLNRRVIGLKR